MLVVNLFKAYFGAEDIFVQIASATAFPRFLMEERRPNLGLTAAVHFDVGYGAGPRGNERRPI
ncbi:MAG: hypothetical protein KC524_11585 [Gammaproteobacteria bacterium]|nr:hypothetical protein [Gammaproteobacteria bacterium]